MSTSYYDIHGSALDAVTDKGVAVSFTLDMAGAHNPLTETYGAPMRVVVQGYAIQVKGEESKARYEMLEDDGSEQSHPVNLFFVPSTFGQVPALGSSCMWLGERKVLQMRRRLAPGGDTIGLYLVLK